MFTRIVKATASITKIDNKESLLRYAVEFPPEMLAGLDLGASVAVDGVCQTVVSIDGQAVWFEAISATLLCTTLAELAAGSVVNLERSAKIGDEIGGHLLSGHIFGTAKIVAINENTYTFSCPQGWLKYLFPKGYIAIDGVSLTLGQIKKETGAFEVHLIPETLKRTTLSQKKVGSLVNLEFDPQTLATVHTIENMLAQR